MGLPISISPAELKEKRQDVRIAEAILNLRIAIRSNNPEVIANALHEYELPGRTERRFEYAIEWEILGADQVELWKEIKRLYHLKEVMPHAV